MIRIGDGETLPFSDSRYLILKRLERSRCELLQTDNTRQIEQCLLLFGFDLGLFALAHLSLSKLRMTVRHVQPQVAYSTAFGAHARIGRDQADFGLSFDLETGYDLF